MTKLLSIIIPTRNRQVYCLESIKSILIDIDNRCEIVVQDNSSDFSLKEYLKELSNENIVYNYNPNPLSFIDNFEQAVNLSSGKYFIILGDDDSITKDILPIVEWMDKEGVESLASTNVFEYFWPNENITKYKNGLVNYPIYKGGVTEVNTDENLKALIRNGFLSYQAFNLPRTYHGIVKRSCMDKVKRIGGRYFGGLTPDIYSTIALACVINNHKIIDYPFSIAGACPASATANATIGGHSGKLNIAPHFNNRGPYEWEPTIPRYYSVETIWAETAIKALKDMKYLNWENEFNKYKLYVYSIYLNRKYILNHSILETLKVSRSTNLLTHVYNLCKHLSIYIYRKYTKNSEGLIYLRNSKDNISSFQQCKIFLASLLNGVSKFN